MPGSYFSRRWTTKAPGTRDPAQPGDARRTPRASGLRTSRVRRRARGGWSTSGYVDPDKDFKLFLFVQQPNGTLGPPQQFPTHATLNSDDLGIAAADLNDDGATDVAVTTRYGVDLFFQSGGTLDGPALLPGTATFQQVEATDLDGDGDPDLVIRAGFDGVLVARNEGLTFTVTSVAADNQTEVEVGDVTGDGRPDIVGFEQRYLHVIPQLLDGSFGDPIVYEAAIDSYPNAQGLEVADVTGDGRLDAVLSIGGNRPSSLLNVFEQNALGTFNAPVIYPSYDIPEPVEALDMDHDGRADVVTLHGGWQEAGFYAQRLDGTLGVESRFDLPYASHYNPKGLALGMSAETGSPTSWPRTSATGSSFFARPRRRHRLFRLRRHLRRHPLLRLRLRRPRPVHLLRRRLRLSSRLRWHRPRHHLPRRPRAVACLESSVASSRRRHGRSGGPAVPWAASVASVRGAGADGSWLSSHVRDGSCRDMAA